MERIALLGTPDTSISISKADYLKKEINELSAELNVLNGHGDSPCIPQTDYLKKCHAFYMQHNLYHLSVIDFFGCMKSIPFYDLKHFFQDVIAGLYIENGKITAIEFCTEQKEGRIHQFS